jgi:hypothetical protein
VRRNQYTNARIGGNQPCQRVRTDFAREIFGKLHIGGFARIWRLFPIRIQLLFFETANFEFRRRQFNSLSLVASNDRTLRVKAWRAEKRSRPPPETVPCRVALSLQAADDYCRFPLSFTLPTREHASLANFGGDADMKADSTMKSRVFLSGITA